MRRKIYGFQKEGKLTLEPFPETTGFKLKCKFMFK